MAEVTVKFLGDPRSVMAAISQIRTGFAQLSQAEVGSTRQAVLEAARLEQRRVSDTVRSANQRLREEQRAAREVARINAETVRQAAAQERVRERSAKQLADVQIREAKRAARELERSLAQGRAGSGGDLTGTISGFSNQIPVVGRLVSQYSSLTSGATAAAGGVAAATGAVALFVVGAGAGIAAAGVLASKFFDLTKQTADFQGKFFDLSQQVGVTTETLSTLDVIASTTGGNIDTVTASLAIFQRNLEDSHDPTSKEAKLLKELGVTSLDTETALRQTLRGLFNLGEGTKQTDAVLQLFGRSGRFVNAILKESKGDIDEAAKAWRGLVVTREAAIAADQFNDSLRILNRTIDAITRNIVVGAIPAFTVLFRELNTALTGNANDWRVWSEIVESQIAGVTTTFKSLVQFIASRGTIDFGVLFDANLRDFKTRVNRLRFEILAQAATDQARAAVAAAKAGTVGDRPDPEKARKDAEGRAAKDLAIQQRALEERTRAHKATIQQEREQEITNIDEWENQSRKLLTDHLNAQQTLFDQEEANARRFVTGQADLLLVESEILQKRTALVNRTLEELDKLELDAQKKRDAATLREVQRLFELTEIERQGRLEAIKQSGLVESDQIRHQITVEQDAFEERKSLINQELGLVTTVASRREELLHQLEEAELAWTNRFTELSKKRMGQLAIEAAANVPSPDQGRGVSINPVIPIDIGPPPPPDFSAWESAFSQLKAIGEDAFLSLAEGFGSMVQNWVLLGKEADVNMRKLVASVLAGVAAQAATLAVFHTAMGIVALTPWGSIVYGSAAQHFTAAAIWAGVAAGAAGLGRITAGNAFQRESSSGASASAGGASRNTQALTAPTPINADRNRSTANQQALVHTLEFRVKGDVLVDQFVRDYNLNGRTRVIIKSDGQG